MLADLGSPLPVWRVHAQDELIRRGTPVRGGLLKSVLSGDLNEMQATWAIWAVGRINAAADGNHHELVKLARSGSDVNLRVQATRILGECKVSTIARTPPPSALVAGMEKTEMVVRISHLEESFHLYRKAVDAGEVVLGRNQLGGSGGESMYQVFLKGADTEETTAAAVEPLLAKADKTRGEEIFFGRGTCFACHQVKGRGMVIGPEHSGMPSFAYTLSPQDVADIIAWIMDLK